MEKSSDYPETTWKEVAEWYANEIYEEEDKEPDRNWYAEPRMQELLGRVGLKPVDIENISNWGEGNIDVHCRILAWMDDHGLFGPETDMAIQELKEAWSQPRPTIEQDPVFEFARELFPLSSEDPPVISDWIGEWNAYQVWTWLLREGIKSWVNRWRDGWTYADDAYYDYYPLEGEYWISLLERTFRFEGSLNDEKGS